VSDQSSANCSSATCCAWKFAAALLLLRFCLGWHFFSEGTKKLSYDQGRQEWNLDFSAEGFFRGATGPFAGLFKSQLPGFYDWENLLAVPRQSTPPSEAELTKQRAWISDYTSRRKRVEAENEKKKKAGEPLEPLPIELPEFAPYKAWGEKIIAGLRSKLKKFTDLSGISEEQSAAAADLFIARHQQLADFLDEQAEAVEEYQHELWRLQGMAGQGGADEIPFRQERVNAKRSETKGLGGRLVSEVRGIERGFNDDLRGVLTAEQGQNAPLAQRVEATLTNPKVKNLHRLNVGVTCLIIGVGICLLLGLFTRLAAVGGIVFLLSVMVSQLPWVPGARADYFYYQLVECAALLVLLLSGP